MNYQYKNMSVPGGGFVTGFLFHPQKKDVLYLRTDIGGIYRYDFENKTWIALVDQVKNTEKWKTYPLSIALDPAFPERVYMSVGEHENSAIGYSNNYGKDFVYLDTPKSTNGVPVEIHGNAPGRSTGERLLVDPFNSNILYLGTMYDGLFMTMDQCKSWIKVPVGSFDEQNISFVAVDERAGILDGRAKRLIVGTNGASGSLDGNVRGESVYISNDGGRSFVPLKGNPAPALGGPKDHPGYVGQRVAFDESYMYITYSAYNIGWSNWKMYGCDTGKCYDGALIRFALSEDGNVTEAIDLTPEHPVLGAFKDEMDPERRIGYGLSGICTDPNHPGVVILSTITAVPDVFYRSTDYGKTFIPVMAGLEIGKMEFEVSYQQPKYNGNHSLVHWMSDIKINPFDSNMALFNSGTGVFVTYNLADIDQGNPVVFHTLDQGVEETVHLNVYSPVSGNLAAIDVIGDLGMFCFEDPDVIPENTVADRDGNRWITAMNADFSDAFGNVLIATMRGNWTGMTKGGLIVSYDGGKTFEKLPDPTYINEKIDAAIQELKRPNVTSGWVAMSADEKHIVWAVGQPLDGDKVLFTHNYGKNYGKTEFISKDDASIYFEGKPAKIFSDRVNPELFYAFADFSEGPKFFASENYGETFYEFEKPVDFPNQLLAGIDSEQHVEIRGIPGKQGEFYMALQEDGLWLVCFQIEEKKVIAKKLSSCGDVINRIGIGINPEGEFQYLFTSGTISGEYGFYLSKDFGSKWERINDDDHNYGDIRSIDGDKKIPGRFYIATGTRGLVYGTPK